MALSSNCYAISCRNNWPTTSMSSDQVRRAGHHRISSIGLCGAAHHPLVHWEIPVSPGPRHRKSLPRRRSCRPPVLHFAVNDCGGIGDGRSVVSLFPTRRDYLALKPLPVRLYQIFVARFLSSLLITMVVITVLNLAPSMMFPFLTSGRWQSFELRYVVAHAVATFGAGLFLFFALGAGVQGILMNLLAPRAFDRLSVWIQALFATAFITAAPWKCVRYMAKLARDDRHRSLRWMLLFPPASGFWVYMKPRSGRESLTSCNCVNELSPAWASSCSWRWRPTS